MQSIITGTRDPGGLYGLKQRKTTIKLLPIQLILKLSFLPIAPTAFFLLSFSLLFPPLRFRCFVGFLSFFLLSKRRKNFFERVIKRVFYFFIILSLIG